MQSDVYEFFMLTAFSFLSILIKFLICNLFACTSPSSVFFLILASMQPVTFLWTSLAPWFFVPLLSLNSITVFLDCFAFLDPLVHVLATKQSLVWFFSSCSHSQLANQKLCPLSWYPEWYQITDLLRLRYHWCSLGRIWLILTITVIKLEG